MWVGLKDDLSRELLQFRGGPAQLLLVGDGLLHFLELLGGERDGDGLLSDLAGPLAAGSSAFAGGAVLHRTLTDVAARRQFSAQTFKLPLQASQRERFLVHGTETNQERYPQPSKQKAGCGFPALKFLLLFSLNSGSVLSAVTGMRTRYSSPPLPFPFSRRSQGLRWRSGRVVSTFA